MKKRFLTLLGGALLGLFSMNATAQTDVTSTYLVNPSFEGSSVRFLDINTDRGVEKPEGWSVEWYQDNNDKNGMTFVAASMTQDDKTWSCIDGKAYFVRMRWANSTIYLRQTLQNLIPGNYTLSFAAVAHTSATGKNALSVSVAGQTKTVNVVSNESGTWNNYDVEFTVADGSPYATIEIKGERNQDLFKFGVDNFVLTYDGSSYYETALEKAQDVYDDNKDWAEGADALQTTITNAGGKTTVDDKNAAIFALIQAVKEFKAANTVDMTSKILNPNFESNIGNWTVSGGDGNAFGRQTSTQVNFNGGFLEKWRNGWNGGYNQKNLDIQQTILNLPNGEYEIKVAVIAQMQGNKETLKDNYKNKKHGGPYYIDDNHGVWVYGTSGTNSGTAWANTQNPSFTNGAGGEFKTATVKVENGELTIGLKAIGSNNGGTELGTYANWIACDNWTLSYFGFDASGLLADLNSMIPDDYTEKHSAKSETDLKNAIEAAEGLIEAGTATKTEITTASTNLANAIAAVEASIADYAALQAAIDAVNYTVVTPSDNENYIDIATAKATAQGVYYAGAVESCADAIAALDAAVKAAKVADYTYVTDNFQYGVELGTWTTTGHVANFSNEHWSGTTHQYKNQDDSNGRGWNSSTGFEIGLNQDVTLPAGKYVFKACGRKSAGATMELTVTIGSDELTVSDFPVGSAARGINKSGATSFDEDNDAYANNGNGFGWQWRFVPFELTEETTINVAVSASATVAHEWASFGDYSVLTDNEANIAMIAYNIALNDANIALAADAYKNVTGVEKTTLQNLVAADMTGKTSGEIEAATTALQTATAAFTAAAPAYDAYVAYMAKVDDLDDDGKAKFAELESDLEGLDETTISAGVIGSVPASYTEAIKAQTTPGTDLTGIIVNAAVTSTDGWNGSRTNADQQYTDAPDNTYFDVYDETKNMTQNIGKLQPGNYSLKCATRASTGMAGKTGNIYVSQNSSNLASTNIHTDGSTGGELGNGWSWTEVIFAVTDAASDITIGFYSECGGSQWAGADNFSLTYLGDAKANMTITDVKWGTFVAPFDVTIPEGVEAYTVTGVMGGAISMEPVETTIIANTPVLVYSESEVNKTFYGKAVSGDPTTDYLVGVYEPTKAPAGSYILMLHNDKAVFGKVVENDEPTVGANRCYLNVPGGTSSTILRFGDATGIQSVEQQAKTVIYDLTGRRVDAAVKGIYIVNGKKMLVK